ncbi:MAG: TIGR02996 domain-containing protein [Archangiaceae bacterium]|nr:TIGR02996 domain-containing protein [Archangiaceae bacterium]
MLAGRTADDESQFPQSGAQSGQRAAKLKALSACWRQRGAPAPVKLRRTLSADLETQVKVRPVPRRKAAPEHPALLDAVLAAPHDDAPRLVYADWLQERGDARGELILVQCRLQQLRSKPGKRPPQVKLLEARAAELIAAHQREWLAPLMPFIRSATFERGFLSTVTGDAGKLLEGLPLLAREPLEGLTLTGYRAALLDAVYRAAPHPTARVFGLAHARLKGDGYAALDAPLFSTARTVDLCGNDFSEPGRLARCTLPALERLRLTVGGLTDAGLRELAGAPFFARLTHLSLDPLGTSSALTSLEPLAAARSLRWLEGPFDAATLKHLLATGLRKLKLCYQPHDEPVTASLRAYFGPPAAPWEQLPDFELR